MNLDFLVPEFSDGLNVTVRLGRKWASVQSLDEYPITALGVPTDKVAIIHGVYVCPFTVIDEEVLALEHDSSCRNINGLRMAMKAAYGDVFYDDSEVTVVLFTVKSDDARPA